MKLCFCISGQLRGDLSTLIHLKRVIDALREVHSVSVVVSTWSEISRKLDGAIGYNQLKRIFTPDVVNLIPDSFFIDNNGQYFWREFSTLYDELNSSDDANIKEKVKIIIPDAVIDIESSKLLDLHHSVPPVEKNIKKMLYKIWRCNEIKKSLEKSSNEKFDIVVRLRPDLFITNDTHLFDINNVKDNHVYIPDVTEKPLLNDMLAYGKSDEMDYYSNFFLTSYKEEWAGIHSELYKYLSYKLKPVRATHLKIDHIDGGVLLNFDKVKKYSPLFKKYACYLDRGIDSIEDINNNILKNTNQHEINSLIRLKSYIYEIKEMWRESLSAYLSADLSSIDQSKYQPAKLSNILNKISFLIDKAEFTNINSIINFLFNSKVLNEMLLSNLVFIHKRINLPFFCNDVNFSNVSYVSCFSKQNLKTHFAYICRDKALEFENIGDINKAAIFMKMAKNYKPDGPLINEKLKIYEKTNS